MEIEALVRLLSSAFLHEYDRAPDNVAVSVCYKQEWGDAESKKMKTLTMVMIQSSYIS
jgi:hypothetical protein